jgi:hypothetical protein
MIFGFVITKKDPAVKVRDGGRIRCPKCGWEPRKDDQWLCEPGCGTVWNTFETSGLCPGCGKQWTDTVCLRCHQWSPHDDWYVTEDDK